MREMNAQRVNITMRDGSVFRGYINIGSCRRISDFFRKSDTSPFIVMFEAAIGESKEKGVYFLNWSHILWVQPDEDDPGRILRQYYPGKRAAIEFLCASAWLN